MTDERSRKIFNVRAQIQVNKRLGFIVQPIIYLGKKAVRILCKRHNVDFLIDPESLADLKLRWYASKLAHFVSFYDWLLKTEVD